MIDNSDCYWGGELDGIWDYKSIETNCLISFIAGMENWETCVCFCSSYFPCVYCQASPWGRVYGSTSAATKKIYLKKSAYKQCEPRQKVNNKTLHKAYFSSSFRRKTGSIRPTSSVGGSISLQNLF